MDDLVACAIGERASVEIVIFAEAQRLVVAQAMLVEEGAPHQRLQKAYFAAPHAASRYVSFDEADEIDEPGGRGESVDPAMRGCRLRGIDERDVVRNEVPAVLRKQLAQASRKEEIICVEHADKRRMRDRDRMIARGRGAAVFFEANDIQPPRSVIRSACHRSAVIGRAVIDDDDFCRLRFGKRRSDRARYGVGAFFAEMMMQTSVGAAAVM